MDANRKFENEDQLKSYLDENYDLSPVRFVIMKSVCEYLEMDDKIIDSDFEGIKFIFGEYITKRISDLDEVGLSGGALTGLRARDFIDRDDQLTLKGFQIIKMLSYHLTYLKASQ